MKPDPMPADYADEAGRIATRVSWAYARRCSWVDRRDLENQCWVIAIEAYWQYVDQGHEFESAQTYSTLAYVACMRQLSRVLYRMQSPVNSSNQELKTMVRTVTAISLEKAELFDEQELKTSSSILIKATFFEKLELFDEQKYVDNLLIVEELRQKIRYRIFCLMGNEPEVEASTAVFLDGYKPAEAAKTLGLDVGIVYKCNDCLIDLSRSDQELGMLATQLGEERNWI